MKDVIISDLSQCQPTYRLDRDYRHGTWRLIDYETGPGRILLAQ